MPDPVHDSGVGVVPDGGSMQMPDADLPDADVADAGTPDAGLFDAGTPDSGTPDAGRPKVPIFVIGGQDQRFMISADGKTWGHDQYVAPNGEDNAWSTIAVGAGVIIAAGDPGIYRSTDGISWTLAMMRPSRFALHGSQSIYAGGAFVVVGQGESYRSVDGITWTPSMNTGSSGHWQGIAYGNGHYVAIGDGHRKVSEDGLTWHDYNATAEVDAPGSIAFGNGVFVAVGKLNNMARITTSTDGVTWREQPQVATLYMTGFGGVSFGNGKFLSSDCCTAFESVDGQAWTKRASGHGGGIAFAAGTFVSSGWRTNAFVYDGDAGSFSTTFSGDQPNKYDDAGIAPWFTAIGAGEL